MLTLAIVGKVVFVAAVTIVSVLVAIMISSILLFIWSIHNTEVIDYDD